MLIGRKSASSIGTSVLGMRTVLLVNNMGEKPRLARITLRNRASIFNGTAHHYVDVTSSIPGAKLSSILTALIPGNDYLGLSATFTFDHGRFPPVYYHVPPPVWSTLRHAHFIFLVIFGHAHCLDMFIHSNIRTQVPSPFSHVHF